MPDRCLHTFGWCDCPSPRELAIDAQYDRDDDWTPDTRPWVLPEWMGGTEEAVDPQRAVDDADDARADQDWGDVA